jgi:outer membrane cobalamin receptor
VKIVCLVRSVGWGLGVSLLAGAVLGQATKADLSAMSLDELTVAQVFTASGHMQDVGEAPSSVTVITGREIAEHGYRTLADVLQTVRGFFVTNDRNYSSLGVRGFARPGDFNTRILLLVDGHRLNDDIYSQAMLGTEFPIDVDLISRIEIIRGPNSALYGSNALFVVINIFSKTGKDMGGVELSTEAESENAKKGTVSYGGVRGRLEYLVSGTFYGSRGANSLYFPEFDTPETNHGIASHLDGDQVGSGLTTLSYRGVTLRGVYGTREKEIPTASYGTVFDAPGTSTVDTHGYVDARYERTAADGWDVMARGFYDRDAYRGIYVYPSANDPADLTQTSPEMDFGDGRWWGTEMRAARTMFARNRVMGGFEYRDNVRQNQTTYDLNPYTPQLLDARSSYVAAAYLQDETTLSKSFVLSGGVRYDHYSSTGSDSVDPRVALIYNRPKSRTALKLMYGQAFRAPNVYEMYYSVAPNVANPALRPETVDTSEGAWEQGLGSSVSVSTSVFYTRMKDLITQAPPSSADMSPSDFSLIYENLQNVTSTGVEMEISGQHREGTDWEASYAFQETKDSATEQFLSHSPRSVGKLNVSQGLWNRRLVGSVDAQYRSRVLGQQGNMISPFTVVNATLLGRRIGRHGELSASVYNVLNKTYADPPSGGLLQGSVPQDGRSFRLKMTWHVGGKD